jgi:hypothetical protein
MAFQVSPGVEVKEIDLTNIVPAVSTTATGFAGFFDWGPLEQRITVTSNNQLRRLFGGPTNTNSDFFFTASNFLNYGANLQVVRVVNQSTSKNAGTSAGFLIKNETDYVSKVNANSFGDNVALGRFPGGEAGINSLGNSLMVAISDTTHREVKLNGIANDGTTCGFTFDSAADDGARIIAGTTFGDLLVVNGVERVITNNSAPGATSGVLTVTPAFTNREASATAGLIQWKYANNFSQRLPATSQHALDKTGLTGANDLLHVAVIDENGYWTGQAGTILETFDSRSKIIDAKDTQGANMYYRDAVKDNSLYIFLGDHLKGKAGFATSGADWGITASNGITFASLNKNFYGGLTGGLHATPSGDDYFTEGYELFQDPEIVDMSVILGGPQTGNQAKSIDTMVQARKDAVAFFSPPKAALLTSDELPRESYKQVANIRAYRNGTNASSEGGTENYTTGNLNISSSYSVLDSGWKYQFDRFNDVFRYVPLNGDVAGVAVRSDFESETWFSPAGFNRGQIQNVVNLALNPVRTERDTLYQAGVNPVISQPGQGTVLFGDKTLLAKPSAFDRINVRRLFIVLEKAISTAAKFSLFELNDRFTRAQFKNLIEPFLLDVQARRGITDFRVICDETNNTPEIIDRNEFVADIFVQPTRSINFITLNFIATRTGVNFDEIAGVV